MKVLTCKLFLANERTLLAWVRTGLALIAGGVAIAFTIGHTNTLGTVAGVGAIIFGGIISLLGYRRYRTFDHAIRNNYQPRVSMASLLIVVVACIFSALLLITGQAVSTY